ncbi:MAG: hypothetical protein LBT66_07740 [Methanobrevibacter sp.]|jgi:type II secretory pathway component GspD/PulD (secretin)|nr:hypothetical protein [Candidatus Methanovirga meridionalis]
MNLNFIKKHNMGDETGFVSLLEILSASIIIILALLIFNTVSEIHISTPQEVNINEVQDILDSLSFKSLNQLSLLETCMKKLEDEHFSKKSYDEVNSLLENYLNKYSNKNYQIIEFSSSQNPITLVSKGSFNNANNLKTAVRNIGDYKFLLYVWD